ncbi:MULTISPECIES: hypothetical protein [unclassified Anabaena]|uniref:hypothetical protein n=1 Tax=unclassified Anabaena TaxID=2619674 RepID=UPI00082F81A6|nr:MULTISPECIES: hypothetical protein [unclassified Anabaena]
MAQNKTPKTNWQSNMKIGLAGLFLSGIIALEATNRLPQGTAIATCPVVVTIFEISSGKGDE